MSRHRHTRPLLATTVVTVYLLCKFDFVVISDYVKSQPTDAVVSANKANVIGLQTHAVSKRYEHDCLL